MSDYIPPKKKFKSSFDILPNEIFLHIFDYLTSNDIIYSFMDCNQRLQHLLLTKKYHFKTPTTNLNFWNKTLPIIGSQIQTLVIDNDYLTLSFDFFPNLTSIIISSPYSLLDGQLKSILNHQCFQKLNTFKIKDVILSKYSYDKDVLDDEQILFKTIFDNNNNLQAFEYLPVLGILSYRNLDQLKSNIHIHSLTLNLVEFHDIFTLIQNTPNLIYLNIQSEMPNKESRQHQSTDISQIKLEKLHLKFKPYNDCGGSGNPDCDQLFLAIQLFSSSLITLSLNFIDEHEMDSTNILFNGIELENKLLKSMKKLQNFYFYAYMYKCENIQKILSTFETFPWSIGAHQNAYLYSLPFPFHELKHFRDFQHVLSNNNEILKHHHQLWCKVTSLKLIRSNRIDFKNLFPLIKLNMPKLSSITFCGTDPYNFSRSDDVDASCDEFERINVQFDNVTTVGLEDMSMKQIQQILMYSFPNLQCLILDRTELPSKKSELSSFLGRKIQRIKADEPSLQENPAQEKGFSYLSNLKHLKLTYGSYYCGINPESRSQIISNLLTKSRKLKALCIYAIAFSGCESYGPGTIFDSILNGLDENQIRTEYKIKYSGDYMWFIRHTVCSSF